MNGVERVSAAIARKKTDRAPLSYEATYEVTESLIEHFQLHKTKDPGSTGSVSNQPTSGQKKYGLFHEIRLQKLLGVDQTILTCPTNPANTIGNWWGLPLVKKFPDGKLLGAWDIKFQEIQYSCGAYIEIDSHPLSGERTLSELEAHPSPSLDLWDFEGLKELVAQYDTFYIWLGVNGCFDFARFMRGTEDFLVDLAITPEKAEVLLDKVNDLAIAYFDACMAQIGGKVHGVYCGDDFGTQRGLIISPDMWRTFIKPRYNKLISHIKAHGLKYCHHTCGGVKPIIPDLIEIGVDVLNPIQPLAVGMEPEAIAEEFGKAITFYGGIDEQRTLPKGSRDDVIKEVKDRLATLGKYGGYIVAPSHSFQPDTPIENVLAVYETALGRSLHP